MRFVIASFLVALGALLAALLVGIALEGIGAGRREPAQRDVTRFDTW